MKSTSEHYGSVAVSMHWLSALLIIALIGTGFRTASFEVSAAKASLLSVHAPLGIAVLLLTLCRIAWWVFADRKPAQPIGDPAWQAFLAKTVHVLLYVVTLGMAASGIGMMVLSGAGEIVFGGSTAPMPDFWNYPPRIPHGFGARAMLVLLAFHAAAALYHHFIRKDRILRRMWFSSAQLEK